MRRLLYWTTKKLYALLTAIAVNVCLCKCVTIQFTEPEGAFLLKPISDSTSAQSSVKSFSASNYSFVVLKGGHVGNKLTVTDSGFTVEENLEHLLSHNYSNSALLVQLLNTKISKEQPSVRVFVHHRHNTNSQKQNKNTKLFPCVVVYAVYKSQVVFGQCRPQVSEMGVCVVDLVIPLAWWPRRPYNDNPSTDDPPKRPKTIVKIGYIVAYDDDQVCHNEPTLMTPKTIDRSEFDKSLLYIGEVELIMQTEYICLPFDKILNILVPNKEFHPGNIFTSTIYFRYNPVYTEQPPYLFQIRCHASEGIRILGTEEVPQSGWTAPSEMNYKLSTLTITAFYRGQFNANESWSGEIITLVLQVAPDAKHDVISANNENVTTNVNKPTLTSSISYIADAKLETGLSSSSSELNYDKNENITKTLNVQTSFNIEKDVVQILVPVGKFDLVNTAVLTGQQVAVGLKIYSLTHAGIISDVTLQSTCTAREPSVLKVTPSCTSVYIDGSESRGDTNASVDIDFGNYKGIANYKVWYPEFPVDISLADPVLHTIKSWRTVDRHVTTWRRRRKIYDNHDPPKLYSRCRLRYQESLVNVFARFRVDDLSTGRRSYLGGRKLQMDVTYLSRSHLKVIDPKVAQLKFVDGVVLVQGNYPGRTELKLISPYSRIPFGAGQVEVTDETLSIRNLRAQSLAGISLTVTPDSTLPDVYTIVIHRSRIFTKKYQEGHLSVEIEYKNGFSFPLNLIDVADYRLDVAVKDQSLALINADNRALGMPNFLTLEEAKGNMLYLSLFPSPPCQRDVDGHLISTTVFVEAYFPVSDQQASSKVKPSERTKETLSALVEQPQRYVDGIAQIDHSKQLHTNLGMTVRPSNEVPINKHSTQVATITPAEVAMYIFLAIFALIGSAFALHCFASNSHRPKFKYLFPDWLRFFDLSERFNGIFRREPIASARQEFVWVGPEELQDSLTSRCSHRLLKHGIVGEEEWEDCDDEDLETKCATMHHATFPVPSSKSAAYRANRISYLGSEVSIHMCPKPLMEVHGPHGRRAASWNHGRSVAVGGHHHRVRITSNPIGDSSSEQNLSSYCALSPPPWTAHSAADLHWDSTSLGMNETQLRDYFNSLRESMA